MITKLAFYDFDGSLFNTPSPEKGKIIWKQKTGEEFPHIGWWSKSESLDNKVFNIQPIKNVLDRLRLDIRDRETYTVLLTSRMYTLIDEIKAILMDHGINFNELSLKKNEPSKAVRIKEFLKRFPDVKQIDIYDDRVKEINVLKELMQQIGDKYDINLYMVGEGKYSMVETKNSIENIINEEIGKFNNKQNLLK